MASIGFDPTFYQAGEADGTVDVVVKVLSGDLSEPVIVSFETTDGTAQGMGYSYTCNSKIVCIYMFLSIVYYILYILTPCSLLPYYSPAPGDYTPVVEQLTFDEVIREVTVSIPIVEDNVFEPGVEDFGARITLASAAADVDITRPTAEITIIDDDGECSTTKRIQFEFEQFFF